MLVATGEITQEQAIVTTAKGTLTSLMGTPLVELEEEVEEVPP